MEEKCMAYTVRDGTQTTWSVKREGGVLVIPRKAKMEERGVQQKTTWSSLAVFWPKPW